MEKVVEPDVRDPFPDDDGDDGDDGLEPVEEDDVELVEAPGFPAAADVVVFDAVELFDVVEVVLLPDALDVAAEEGDVEEEDEELLRPGPELVALLELPVVPGLVALAFESVEDVLPDFGTLDLVVDDDVEDVPSDLAPTFSAFRSIVTGRLDAPVEEDVALLPGFSDDPDPFPPEEDDPPEDFLSVAI